MKKLLYFTGGLIIGAGVSFMVCRKYFQNEINSLNDYYIHRCKPIDETAKEEKEDEANYATASNVSEIKKPVKAKKASAKKKEAIDYAAFGKKEEEESMTKEQGELTTKAPKGKKIYMITSDDFIERNNFKKEYLTYFEEDDVFLNENNEVVDNGKKLVGASNLKKIDECETNVMYVRNETEGTDYEIIFEDGHYEDFQDEV